MRRKLFVPTIGTELTLARDWMPAMYLEYRNEKLIKSIFPGHYDKDEDDGGPDWYPYGDDEAEFISSVCFPKGTVLRVNRIYIRQGAPAFDSITFTVAKCPRKEIKGRFWVKLADANKIEFEDRE